MYFQNTMSMISWYQSKLIVWIQFQSVWFKTRNIIYQTSIAYQNFLKEKVLYNFCEMLFLRLSKSKNIWMVNCLVFAICYFRLFKNWCLQKVYSFNKWELMEIIDKNVFKIITLSNSLVLFCRFQNHNFVLCSLYMAGEIYLFC